MGQEVLGIKQGDYTGQSVCINPHPPAKKAVCMTHAHVEGYCKEEG